MRDPLHTGGDAARMSMPAVLTVGVLHLGVVWLLLQASPVVRQSEQVVYQMIAPITQLREPTRAIAPPAPTRAKEPAASKVVEAAPPPTVTPALRTVITEPNPQLEKPVAPVVVAPVIQEPAVRPAAITPVEARTGSAPSSGASPLPVAPATGTPSIVMPSAGGYPYRLESQPRQKSFAEMANEQNNPGGRKDTFSNAVSAAEKPDCINSGQTVGLLAPALIAYNVARDKCK